MFWLVVWNMNFIFPFSWECHHPNWRTHIFQRGRSTTNQTCFFWDLFGLWNHQIQRLTNLGAVTWVTSARFNPSHSMWNLCSAGPEMNMEIYMDIWNMYIYIWIYGVSLGNMWKYHIYIYIWIYGVSLGNMWKYVKYVEMYWNNLGTPLPPKKNIKIHHYMMIMIGNGSIPQGSSERTFEKFYMRIYCVYLHIICMI